MAPFCCFLPTAYRSLARDASVQKRARNAWHVRARRRDDNGLRCDDERALRRGRALEHLLDHGLERGHDRPVRDVLGRAPDLVALERLGVVHGDGDAAVIRGEVAQRRVQEHVTDDELAVVRHVLERDWHHIRHTGSAGGQIPHVFFEQFFDVFVERDSFLLVVFELVFRIAGHAAETRYPQIYERLINFIVRLDTGGRMD